jgi:hypothetical protein
MFGAARLGAVLAVLSSPALAQATSMTCRFLPGNAFFSSYNPRGERNEIDPNRHCPVRLTLEGRSVRGEELCAGLPVPKGFKGTVVANGAYPGNIIVLWSNETAAEAQLWAISFERREVAVSMAFAAQHTEAGAQWMMCDR